MIVFSAIVPHAPLLIPGVGKDKLDLFSQTITALAELEADLYASRPDVLVILTPHGDAVHDAFTVALNTRYTAHFEEFGDYSTRLEFAGSPQLAQLLKERIMYDMALQFVSTEHLDHGVSVPLYYLARKLPHIELIPITHPPLTHQNMFEFGALMKRELAKTNKRVAVLASGNLSHCLSKQGPAPYSPKGAAFDAQLVDALKRRDINTLLAIQPKLAKQVADDSLRSILILLGIINESNFSTRVLSYEAVLGVGYLVAEFPLQ